MAQRVSGVLVAVALLSGGLVGVSGGEELIAPAPIAAGFAAYKTGGANAAIKGWLKGGPLEGNKEALTQANVLHQVEDYYGAFEGYRVMKNILFTPTCQMTYVEIDYAKGPAFAKFMTFKNSTGWQVMTYLFNTSVEQVWPESMYLRSQ